MEKETQSNEGKQRKRCIFLSFEMNVTNIDCAKEDVLLYIGVTVSILIGYKHAANSCWLCFHYVIPADNSFYTCRSDVIPTDNSFMHAEVTSPNTLNSSLSNFVMAESTSRFATLSVENLALLLDDKDVN